MRFANVPSSEPEQRSVAADFLRRLLQSAPVALEAARDLPADLPGDLDQRVRLIGEW